MNNTKQKTAIKIANIFKPFIFLLAVALAIFFFKCCASAGTIEEYEAKINQNNIEIEHCENIKKQLHSGYTAIREKVADSCVLHAATQGNPGKLRACC